MSNPRPGARWRARLGRLRFAKCAHARNLRHRGFQLLSPCFDQAALRFRRARDRHQQLRIFGIGEEFDVA